VKARSHEVVVLLLLGLVDSMGIIRCLCADLSQTWCC